MSKITRNGLNVSDILMLSYIHNFHTGVNAFQQFWKYRYSADAEKIIQKLLDLGYAKIAPYEITLSHKTVSELKDILKENDLPVSGKKTDLIVRIINKISDMALREYCTPMYYELTDLGKKVEQENPRVLYAHRHPEYNLTDSEIFDETEDIYNIVYKKTIRELKTAVAASQWGLVRNAVFELSEISDEFENYRQAFEFIIVSACIDLSGIANRQALENNIITPGEKTCCVILPSIIRRISKYMDKTYMSAQSFIQDCCRIVDNINLPYSYYSTAQIKDMLINSVLEFRDEPINYKPV